MFKSKKFLGIPLVALIIALGTVIIFGSGFVASQFGYNQSNQASVTILSDELKAYQDIECTIPFDSNVSLNFGEIYPTESSQEVTFYLVNESVKNSKIFPQISVNNLPAGLTVEEISYGVIPNQPDWLDIYIPESLNYIPTGLTAQVGYENITAEQNWMYTSINTMSSSGYIKIDDEILSYSSIDISGRWILRDLERGLFGTIPAPHLRLATVTWIDNIEYIPLDALEKDEVQEVRLVVNASDEVQSGDLSFEVLLQATSEH